MSIDVGALDPVDVLIVEDDPQVLNAMQRLLGRAGYTTVGAQSLAGGMTLVEAHSPEVVLLDLSLPDGDGLTLIQAMKARGVGEVIIVSGTDDAKKTHECLQAGVFDFILKPAGAEDILRSVRRADARRRLQAITPQVFPAQLMPGLGALEGVSVVSQRLLSVIKKIALDLPVQAIITGQPGVMKADSAALIHHYGGRAGSALLVNCASENDDRAVERFFGKQNEPHASDKAVVTEAYLAKADGGTLVLDDISELPVSVQRRLVSFMNSGESISQNALIPVRYDCSIIGILREPADRALSSGRLHQPFFYALSTTTLVVPPLVERRDDIEHFARYAVEQLNRVFDTEKSVSAEMIERLRSHYWPGNLVELSNLMLTAYRSTEPGEEIVADSVLFGGAEIQSDEKIAPFIGQTFAEVESQLIKATLRACDNNKSQSAKMLGISLKTLYNRLSKLERRTGSDVTSAEAASRKVDSVALSD